MPLCGCACIGGAPTAPPPVSQGVIFLRIPCFWLPEEAQTQTLVYQAPC